MAHKQSQKAPQMRAFIQAAAEAYKSSKYKLIHTAAKAFGVSGYMYIEDKDNVYIYSIYILYT